MRFITLFFAVAATALAPVMCEAQGANTNGQGSKSVERPGPVVFPRGSIPFNQGVDTNGLESKAVEQPAGKVVFPRGGISFEVGAGWKQVASKLPPPVCPPMLVGTNGILRTILFAPAISNVTDAVKTMRKAFDKNSQGIKDSFQQNNFTTSGGLSVCHIAYREGAPGDARKTYQVHNYIIQRRDGRMVTVNYTCPSNDFSQAITQLIEHSLKLQ